MHYIYNEQDNNISEAILFSPYFPINDMQLLFHQLAYSVLKVNQYNQYFSIIKQTTLQKQQMEHTFIHFPQNIRVILLQNEKRS